MHNPRPATDALVSHHRTMSFTTIRRLLLSLNDTQINLLPYIFRTCTLCLWSSSKLTQEDGDVLSDQAATVGRRWVGDCRSGCGCSYFNHHCSYYPFLTSAYFSLTPDPVVLPPSAVSRPTHAQVSSTPPMLSNVHHPRTSM
jgi:hypothetical protein